MKFLFDKNKKINCLRCNKTFTPYDQVKICSNCDQDFVNQLQLQYDLLCERFGLSKNEYKKRQQVYNNSNPELN